MTHTLPITRLDKASVASLVWGRRGSGWFWSGLFFCM